MTETSNQKEALQRAEQSNQQLGSIFPGLLGIEMVEVAPERTIGELTARDDLNIAGYHHLHLFDSGEKIRILIPSDN